MKNKIFTPQQIACLDKTKIPNHVAIIPDGNRRWAKKQLDTTEQGHRTGANVLIEIVKAGKELGVKAMTFYLFSTENWSRPADEVALFMWLIEEFLYSRCDEMISHGVKFETIGDLSALPKEVLAAIEKTKKDTANCSQIDMICALNYGGRDDIRRAFIKIMDNYHDEKLPKELLNDSLISQHLDTAPWGDPDLLIRTSGEMRVSNFLLWQISYSEIHVTDVLWPDFTSDDLLKAIIDFQHRERRLGGA